MKLMELWDNNTFSLEVRLEYCKEGIEFWKEAFYHQRDERLRLEKIVLDLKKDISLFKEAVKVIATKK